MQQDQVITERNEMKGRTKETGISVHWFSDYFQSLCNLSSSVLLPPACPVVKMTGYGIWLLCYSTFLNSTTFCLVTCKLVSYQTSWKMTSICYGLIRKPDVKFVWSIPFWSEVIRPVPDYVTKRIKSN